MSQRRLMIIGIDAATLDLVRPWAAAGHLPNLKRFLDHGASGPLQTTLPVQSPAAWSTFATGLNPGKHGVLNFAQLSADSYRAVFTNASHRRGETFWEIAGRHGIRGGVLNMPFTYPPGPYNGFLISGMLTPGMGRRMASPSEIFDDLLTVSPDYEIDINIVKRQRAGEKQLFLERTLAVVAARTRAAVGLYRKHRPPLFCAVFTASDRVIHYFWHDYERAGREAPDGENAGFGDAIRTIYMKIDQAVGALVSEADDQTDVIILSDHGAGPLRKMFSMRKALAREGLLVEVRPGPLKRLAKRALLNFGHYCPRTLRQRIQALLPWLSARAASQVTSGGIDFAHTRAYPTEGVEGVFVNLKGRQPDGMVEPGSEYEEVRDQVITLFREIKDPDMGQRVFRGAYRREDVWHGPCLERMPDVVLELANWDYDTRVTSAAYGSDVFCPLERTGQRGLHNTGRHHRKGLLLAMGPHVKSIEIAGAQIADVPATVLTLLGCPVPEDFDGRVLEDILTDDVDIPRRTAATRPTHAEEKEFAGEDRRAVEERLKGLGYM